MLLHRVLSALVGIPLVLFFIYQGGMVFSIFIFLVASLCYYEFMKMTKVNKSKLIAYGAYFTIVLFFLVNLFFQEKNLLFYIALFILSATFLICNHPKYSIREISFLTWSLVYIGGFLSLLPTIRSEEEGFIYIIYLFVGVWTSDTGAYFAGRFFGKHPLAPMLSPKKTREGAVGGLILTILILSLLALYLNVRLIDTILLALFISLSGQAGDLVISALKREFNVKDSGQVIPGHGGFLDRFDSLILATPVLFIIINFL